MRGKRAKQYRKLMHQYQHTFKFREPYQVLMDAELLQDGKKFTMDVVAGLKRTLQGEVKPMITQCCMRHLYNARPKDEDLITQAKTYERRRCNHQDLEEPLSAKECLLEVVDPKSNRTNKHKYVIATQDREIREEMRRKLGVPLVYINRSVMILEPMAAESENVREREEKSKFRAGLSTRPASASSKRKRDDESMEQSDQDDIPEARQPVKKRKGPKGPNPLSVKKAQKKDKGIQPPQSTLRRQSDEAVESTTNHDTSAKRKRKRKHKQGEKLEQTDGPADENAT